MEIYSTSYRYKALNANSYNMLAAYASTIPADVTLIPETLTIIISDEGATSPSLEVGKFIDNNGIDFQIDQVAVDTDNLNGVVDDKNVDAATLREVIRLLMGEKEAMKQAHEQVKERFGRERESIQSDRDLYQKWYVEAVEKRDRVKEQVKAIALLMNSIFPDD